jgi:predicted TIM-barrel fold metal-dependent hydrolase
MIVDCHTHIWKSPSQLGRAATRGLARVRPGQVQPVELPEAGLEQHFAACRPVDRAIVVGFQSRYLEAHVPNDFVAEYVRSHSDLLIGFAGVDPAEPIEAIEETRRACGELGLRGIAVAPAAQDFHPSSTGALRVFAEAGRLEVPVLFHQGAHLAVEAKLEYARPFLLDEVARELPDLKIIIAHMGYPWVDECIALLGKQPNVYADISGLVCRPWHAYNALLSAYQCGVIRKLVFGSDFPFTSAAGSMEALYSINQIVHGTSLPTVPREQLRAIVECNALDLLGISPPPNRREQATVASVLDDDDI